MEPILGSHNLEYSTWGLLGAPLVCDTPFCRRLPEIALSHPATKGQVVNEVAGAELIFDYNLIPARRSRRSARKTSAERMDAAIMAAAEGTKARFSDERGTLVLQGRTHCSCIQIG